jgi:hypothetical protein
MLEIWKHGGALSTWLVLDQREPALCGTLLLGGGVCIDDDEKEANSWIEWLRNERWSALQE